MLRSCSASSGPVVTHAAPACSSTPTMRRLPCASSPPPTTSARRALIAASLTRRDGDAHGCSAPLTAPRTKAACVAANAHWGPYAALKASSASRPPRSAGCIRRGTAAGCAACVRPVRVRRAPLRTAGALEAINLCRPADVAPSLAPSARRRGTQERERVCPWGALRHTRAAGASLVQPAPQSRPLRPAPPPPSPPPFFFFSINFEIRQKLILLLHT